MVIGYAMLKVHDQLPSPARLWMQVHDEILIVYPKTLRNTIRDVVVGNLRSPVSQMPASPIKMGSGLVFNVDVEVGPNWGATRDLPVVEALEKGGEDPWSMLKS
jgi:DNA polymerase I-like protein with 3'-5' exonuclease and polymerase domains